MIGKNNLNYANDHVRFATLNIFTDKLPKADLILCRDCFVHFSNEQIIKSLQNIKRSKIQYLLTTSFTNRKKNTNIKTGEWQPLNLEIDPFKLKPIEIIVEHCTEQNGVYADKSLILIETTKLFD